MYIKAHMRAKADVQSVSGTAYPFVIDARLQHGNTDVVAVDLSNDGPTLLWEIILSGPLRLE